MPEHCRVRWYTGSVQLDVFPCQPLGKSGQVAVVDLAVAVDVQRGFDTFHVLTGQMLRQPGQVAVVDAAVTVDVAGGVVGGRIEVNSSLQKRIVFGFNYYTFPIFIVSFIKNVL